MIATIGSIIGAIVLIALGWALVRVGERYSLPRHARAYYLAGFLSYLCGFGVIVSLIVEAVTV